MKRFFCSAILLGFMITCTGFKKKDQAKDAGLSGAWIISLLQGVAVSQHPAMKLNIDAGGKKMNAVAVCNTINGTYRLDIRAGTLEFQSLTITWKACADMKTEKQLLDALKAVTHFKSDVNTLRLFHNNDPVVTLIRNR